MGEDKITISDKGETKVAFNESFDDIDLLSAEEQAALSEDVDLDGPAAKAVDSDSHSRAEARKKAEDEANAAAKEAEDQAKAAKEKEDADKAADEKNEELAKKEKEAAAAETEDDKAKAKEFEGGPAKLVPELAPPTVVTGLTEEALKKVNDDKAQAKKDFQEGIIDYDEYLDKRDAFNQQIWSHNMAMQMSSESVDTRWEWEQESFLTDKANAWINDDEVCYSAFAATVNRLMSTDEGAVMPGPELLALAREQVAKRFSPTRQEERIDKEEEDKKKEALKSAKSKEAAKVAPETLGGKPAAEIDEGIGEFDWIDKLDGEAYEKAVENLSEAQLKRYEASI